VAICNPAARAADHKSAASDDIQRTGAAAAGKDGAKLTEIRLENIELRYGGKNVLDNINVSVGDGELCTLVGPSGCGKSLVLRIIAGLVKPSRGTVYFDGRPVTNVAPGDRDIAMVFQRFALYPYMTVRDNWAFPLRAANLSSQEVDARIRATSTLLQMEVLLNRRPTQLSGGQQQRAALGRALVRRPALYLWDEPLGAQDAKRRVELRTDLKKLQMDTDVTTVCVTSDQIEAQALGDKVVVMDVGTIQQVGTPEAIYDRPANLYVAGFVGSPPMNFFDGTLQRNNEQLVFCHSHFEIVLPLAIASRLEAAAVERPVVLGIRPEHVAVRAQEQPAAIAAPVYVAEPESNQVLIDFRLGNQIVRTRCDREDMDCEPCVDQKAYLVLDPDALHLFDKATGRRIS
jgi:multiple sugar transport system ATP-binding protein